MQFRLIIDKEKEEEVVATVHAPSTFTQELEKLVMTFSGCEQVLAYTDEDMVMLRFPDIECITVVNGKTYAIDRQCVHYRLKQRLYELEKLLPGYFIRINKSTLANERCLVRFSAAFSGGVDALFQCGHRDYVSRRCFAEIKRRYEK